MSENVRRKASYRLRDAIATIDLFESWGVAVFPGPWGEKGTRIKGWPAAQVDEACRRARVEAANTLGRLNLAARTGPTLLGNCLAVIDVDGKDGIAPADALNRLLSILPNDIAVSKTGRGFGLWFTVERPVGNGLLVVYGAEIFTDVHLVNLPPSRHPSGVYYEWLIPPGGELP